MTIEKKLEGDTLTIALEGRLDTNTAPELETELAPGGAANVVFDFAGLEYISSAGLRVLMAAHRTASGAGGSVRVRNANDMVRGVFDMTGLSGIFGVD